MNASLAQAKERLFISGVEISEQNNNYGFAAAIVPFKGSSIGNGFVQRYWVEGISYSYEQGTTEIDANALAVEAALGWQQSYARGWYAIYAGALYRNTDLSPNDPSSEAQGDHLRLRMQVEGEHRLTQDFRMNAIASYTTGQQGYWTRLRALHTVSGDIFAGPEVVFHGDDDYRAWQAGGVVGGFHWIPETDLALKIGARHNQGGDTAPYAGIEVSRSF